MAGFERDGRVGADALAVMRLSIFDWAACAFAGRGEAVSRIVLAQAREEGGAPQAGLVGGQLRVPARMAALANATVGHALDYDDTHFAHIGHPSAAVVPAALAAAQVSGAAGAEFLDAALIGAEASVRVGCWLGRGHYQGGFHQTATAGAFGATVAAGRLMGLSASEFANAIGWVAGRASGLKAQFGTMGKPLNAGIAAANGVEAVMLARRGLVSSPTAMDGPFGFGATHAGAADMSAFDGLGARWLMADVSHKYHACCHGLHAMLEALGEARAATGGQAVEQVSVTCHPRWQTVCNNPMPRTGLEAKFSFHHTAALTLAGLDTARLESFSDTHAQEPRLVALRALVTVRFSDVLPETAAEVVLRLRDGREVEARHDLSVAQPADVRQAKLRAKARAIVGEAMADALWDVIRNDGSPEGLARLLAGVSIG